MKVVSVNIGSEREVSWRGKTVKTGIFKEPVNVPIFLGKEDVVDDKVVDRKYHGGIDKACYIYSADCYPFWKEKYPEVAMNFGAFGENITIEGLDEKNIKIGAIYQIGEAKVQVAQPRQPCFKQGIRFGTQKIVKDFLNAPYSGIYLRIIEEGKVTIGDEMIPVEIPCGGISVADVHSLFTANKHNKLLMKMAIKEPFLSESYRKDLIKLNSKIT